MIENKKLKMSVTQEGYVSGLFMKDDPYRMNWVIENEYLKQMGYADEDKLFGLFDIVADGKKEGSNTVKPAVFEKQNKVDVCYDFKDYSVDMVYDLAGSKDELFWTIKLKNKTKKEISVTDFGIWISFAYVMFRDKNVLRNIHNSAALFPSVSTDYTKLNLVRRDGTGENLGVYQIAGETRTIGTYCDYENLFFENASPSLDGMLFHKLYLAGGYPEKFENNDWIYDKTGFVLEAGAEKEWKYVMTANQGEDDFYKNGLKWGHSWITYTPLNIDGEIVRLSVQAPENKKVFSAEVLYKGKNALESMPVAVEKINEIYRLKFVPKSLGEHKAVLRFSDGTEDFVVLNVMGKIDNVLEERVEYICDSLYHGTDTEPYYAFEPISNQGESLGKANLVLMKNLLGKLDRSQVQKAEKCAVAYVRPKWFTDGDFTKPRKLYETFYRCMDFEYIAHLFYLLSEFDDSVLTLNSADTYLKWAAEVFELRINPDLHQDERGKEEAQMLGVYFLYFNKLLDKLKKKGFIQKYEKIQSLWKTVMDRIDKETAAYKAAITEHFYDNAGFGPTAGALSESHREESAGKYGDLLLANIGYSNDFRAQNPDRWWEALTYMIHSLWGGITAAAAYKVFAQLKDARYLKASYRATAGILYCYDTHSTATTPLEKGMAASTYAVAGPHINRPDLSRDRFGQSTFYRDGGIFSRLFENDSQTPDWDMGEELVAYLENFGEQTYILKTENGISVINGSFTETENEYKITSFAPYSRKFYYVADHEIIQIKDQKGLKSITLRK